MEVLLLEAHNSEFVDLCILADTLQSSWIEITSWNKWAKFHPWVQVEKKLIITKNTISDHQDSGLIDLVLAFKF